MLRLAEAAPPIEAQQQRAGDHHQQRERALAAKQEQQQRKQQIEMQLDRDRPGAARPSRKQRSRRRCRSAAAAFAGRAIRSRPRPRCTTISNGPSRTARLHRKQGKSMRAVAGQLGEQIAGQRHEQRDAGVALVEQRERERAARWHRAPENSASCAGNARRRPDRRRQPAHGRAANNRRLRSSACANVLAVRAV